MTIKINFELKNNSVMLISEESNELWGEWEDWDTVGFLSIEINGKNPFLSSAQPPYKNDAISLVILYEFYLRLIYASIGLLKNSPEESLYIEEDTGFTIELTRKFSDVLITFDKGSKPRHDYIEDVIDEVVTISAFFEEVLRSCNNFLKTLLEFNPNSTNNEDFIALKNIMEELKKRWSEEKSKYQL